MGGDHLKGNAVVIQLQHANAAMIPAGQIVHRIKGHEQEIAQRVNDRLTVIDFVALRAVGVAGNDSICAHLNEGAVPLLNAGGGDGVILGAAVENDHHIVRLLLFLPNALHQLQNVETGRTAAAAGGIAGLVFADGQDRYSLAVFLNVSRFVGLVDVHTGAAVGNACLFQYRNGGTDTFLGVVVDVVVGQGSHITACSLQECDILHRGDDIGAALGQLDTLVDICQRGLQIHDQEVCLMENRLHILQNFLGLFVRENAAAHKTDIACK